MRFQDRESKVQVLPEGERIRVKRVQSKVDLSATIAERQRGIYPPEYFYRPVHLISIKSNLCDCHCFGCNLRSTSDRAAARVLPDDLILDLMRQAVALGFIVYNGTFSAEPFDNLAFADVVLREFRGRMDCYAINTSAVRFTSEAVATRLLLQLKAAGWTDTRFVLPFLSISIGMQQARVPLAQCVHGITAFRSVFREDEATLSVSYYKTELLCGDALAELRALYRKMTGRHLDDDVIVKTGAIKPAGRAARLAPAHFRRTSFDQLLSTKNCFAPAHFSYVDPVIIVEPDGGIQLCTSGFGSPVHTQLGNVRDGVTLRDAIDRANRSPFFRLIAEGGVRRVFERIAELDPARAEALRGTGFANRHELCLGLSRMLAETEPT